MTGNLLAVSDLTVRFGGLAAVDSVSMSVGAGEIKGLIGPNGAGKTTLFNAVSGLVPTAAGEITFHGQSITAQPAYFRARQGMRRTFQSVQLAQDLTVLENVALGIDSDVKASWPRILFGISSPDRDVQDRVYSILDELGLGPLALRAVNSLTFVQQRYVEIARALISRPRLLMLDEPAAGLTPMEVQALDRFLVQLRQATKTSILLVEHVMDLVLNVCDHICVLDNGKLIASGTPAEIAADERVRVAYLGGDGNAEN